MARVSVAEFVRSSAAYVRANVRRANADGNKYLTKTESAALPRDLRDNFEHHRVGAQANASVTATKFETRFTDYVAVMAKRADKNADGFISTTEARSLPVDLQDNFRNYRANR